MLPPRSPTACGSLPPEGVAFSLGAARRQNLLPPRSPTACGALPLQGAALSEPTPLRAVQIRAGGFGAAALSPEGVAFCLGAARRENPVYGHA